MKQTFDISDLASLVDAGGADADFAALLQSRATDRVLGTLSFFDATHGLLQSFDHVDTTNAPNYAIYDGSSQVDTRTLGAGTRFVELKFTFTPAGADSTDAFVDNVSLKINDNGSAGGPGTVLGPSSLALIGGALGLLAAGRARRPTRRA